ncbi:hypothetical protein CMUS01_12599 [Colletotrichum musicola]|uniref:Uncharacterized protein n=1 Tax=Colletotrichum musicola TaxID=2175873 RepID=A0A8H6JJZ8_9PEZI|nr:hypothetical protein CMUS01_12599 [Colletotrichum musicola]
MADKSNIRFGCIPFGLPGEVRNMIYKYYLPVDGGYIFDNAAFASSGKFRLMNADCTPVRQGLMFTCKAGLEMRGLGLHLNGITFTTVDTGEDR